MSEPTIKGITPDAGGDTGRTEALPRAFGDFTLLARIAAGERGDVFAALRPVEIERFCALKILPEAAAGLPDFVTALRDEASRVVRRIHGNLVQVYDIGLFDSRLFFVAELVEGIDTSTLLQRLGKQGRTLPIDIAVYVAMEVAAALGYLRRLDAREPGVAGISRLSPGSVLLSRDGEVKIAHYGRTMAAIPTRDALSVPDTPDGAANGASGGAADAFLVGALLSRLVGTSAPPLLARLIERATNAQPAARPADGDEMRAALASALRAMSTPTPASMSATLPASVSISIKGPGAAAAVQARTADLVRAVAAPGVGDIASAGTNAGAVVDRVSLAAIAKAFDPKRGASPPTWKAITLTRLETGATMRARPSKTAVVAPIKLVTGQVIPGTRYRLLSTVGEGGMGTVYAAEHVDLEKKVALKILRADVAPDSDTLQLFRQEARAASKVGSAYICDVTDFGELGDGRVFFVMEFLDGQSLGRVLRQTSVIGPARTIAVLRQVCKALGAGHEKGIVHLDVKPDNVMLLERGRRTDAVKVVDFGIAGLMHADNADHSTIAGTPEYIAPERVAGSGYDARSDIYSLGAMAYEMLSGAVPLQGKNHLATLTMQMKDPPEALLRQPAAKGCPPELAALVMRMLDKDPATRPQSMAEVEALLCEAQIAAGLFTAWDDLELPAVDDAWRDKLAKRMPFATRPRRAVAVVAATVALASLAVAGYFAFVRKPAVVVKEVRVELTRTEEAPVVAAALLKADQAARAERYVRPASDSALHHIQTAEAEAQRLGRKSSGAAMLRRAYASALAVIGNELLKSGLGDLAVAKYKQALMFLPDDPELQAKAQITPEEKKRSDRKPGGTTSVSSAVTGATDDARDAATRVFLAATRGRLSEARLALKALAHVDASGAQAARLADALRARAATAWNAGRKGDARPLYALVAELDPGDVEAKERAREIPEASSAPVAIVPPPPSQPPPPPAPVPKAKKRGEAPAIEPEADLPRDPAASQLAAEAGLAAIARGRLGDAEVAFTRAVRADSQNAVAVGGLAEVAFERARYSEALDYARRATRLAPRVAKHLILTGDAYFKMLRYDQALASYEKARALNPRDEAVQGRIDRVHAKVGK